MHHIPPTIRQVLSEFATGVCIIVGSKGDATIGVTINSFCSVSMDQPLILYCIKTSADSYQNLINFNHFSINILSSAQEELAKSCMMKGGHCLNSQQYQFSAGGIPILTQNIATLECEKVTTYPGGDHTIILAKILEFNISSAQPPLVFHRSKLRSFPLNLTGI